MIVDLFSKRQRKLRGEVHDVYSYDVIPPPLRVQVVKLLERHLGSDREVNPGSTYHSNPEYNREVVNAYQTLVECLCTEYGVFTLYENDFNRRERHHLKEWFDFILNEEDVEKVFDAVELSFRFLNRVGRKTDYRRVANATKSIDAAIEELNSRFKEHGVGFQFENEDIIRVDSEFLHTETVKPALLVLNRPEYAGAQEEFLSAYEHFRHGNQKEALNDALKAFESTIKTICDRKKWPYSPKDTSQKLVQICYEKELIPTFWQQHMTALRSLLEGGVPTGRNKLSGHGQGSTPIEVPDHIVSYVLHMTAAAIVFLVKCAEG
jgi:hypothetical protein